MTDGKRCPKCGQHKGWDHFSKNRARYDGHATWCKTCIKAYAAERNQRPEVKARNAELALARYHALHTDQKALIQSRKRASGRSLELKYGLTLEQYEAMLAEQGGGCAICGRPPSENRRHAVDHDHACCPGEVSCGECVRGILCTTCNVWLGFYENRDWIDRADGYLARREAGTR